MIKTLRQKSRTNLGTPLKAKSKHIWNEIREYLFIAFGLFLYAGAWKAFYCLIKLQAVELPVLGLSCIMPPGFQFRSLILQLILCF